MLHRYLLCNEASPEVAAMVEACGEQLKDFIQRPRRTTAPVHLTLLLVDMPEELAPQLQAAIERGLKSARPFTLHFDGITHFPDKRTIYAVPVEKDIIVKLASAVAKEVRNVPAIDAYAPHATDSPHLSIATSLQPGQFERAWELFKSQPFVAAMKVNEILLMERPLAPACVYRSLGHYAL